MAVGLVTPQPIQAGGALLGRSCGPMLVWVVGVVLAILFVAIQFWQGTEEKGSM